MVYRAIGLMSGSSLDGLDIVFAEFEENAGKWRYEILKADCYAYSNEWIKKLQSATSLSALDYQLLHTDYGHYIGQQVYQFMKKNNLQYQVALIASHGHTSFHVVDKKMTAQLGEGAAIASEVDLPVVTDLRALDVALGGQGAPIVPIGEKFLLGDYDFFLNLGGIANISFRPHPQPLSEREGLTNITKEKKFLQKAEAANAPPLEGFVPKDSPKESFRTFGGEVAFDVCPANRVLNMLVNSLGKEFDEDGKIAAGGKVNVELMEKLNALDYYKQPHPKSLANDFGTDVVYPMIRDAGCEIRDSLRTYVEHIAMQIKVAVSRAKVLNRGTGYSMLATGGGALNSFLIQRLKEVLKELNAEIIVPDKLLINFKEALIMAFMGILRWRQEYNVLSSVTGAKRNSIGGALWNGQEA